MLLRPKLALSKIGNWYPFRRMPSRWAGVTIVSFSLEISYLMQGSSEIQDYGVCCESIGGLNRPGSVPWPPFFRVVCSLLHGWGPLFTLLLWPGIQGYKPSHSHCNTTAWGGGTYEWIWGRSQFSWWTPESYVYHLHLKSCEKIMEIAVYSRRFKNYLLMIITSTIQENSAQEVKCVCVCVLPIISLIRLLIKNSLLRGFSKTMGH